MSCGPSRERRPPSWFTHYTDGNRESKGMWAGPGSPSAPCLAHPRPRLPSRRHEGRRWLQPQQITRVELILNWHFSPVHEVACAGALVPGDPPACCMALMLGSPTQFSSHGTVRGSIPAAAGSRQGQSTEAEQACSPCLPVSSHAQAVANRLGLEQGSPLVSKGAGWLHSESRDQHSWPRAKGRETV